MCAWPMAKRPWWCNVARVPMRRGSISVLDANGMPVSRYVCRDTLESDRAIAAPVNFQKVKVGISLEKVRRARERIPPGP